LGYIKLERFATGSGVPTLNRNDVHDFKVAIPKTNSEQTAIASALSDADNYIASLEKLIAKKRLIKQGAIQKLMQPKEGWGVKSFADITKVITCGLAATPKYVDETIGKPFLSAQNVQEGKVVCDKYKFISKELFELITKHNPPQKGDLLYTRVGAGIGEAGVIEDNFKFGIYVSLTLIRVDEKQLYNYYLLHLLNSPNFKSLAKNGQFAGGGVQNLNVQIVREFLIPLPSLVEQTRIANILSDMNSEITSLEKQLSKAQSIKQGMMQQLLTGKIRLI
jgi:type I restriction enzyme S subunit